MKKITEKLFRNLLYCEYRAYQSLNEDKLSNYEIIENQLQDAHRHLVVKKLEAKYKENEILHDTSDPKLKGNKKLFLNVTFSSSELFSNINALEKSTKRLKQNYYTPILFVHREKLQKEDKMLLGYQGLVFGVSQKKLPDFGKIIYGKQCNSTRISLKTPIKSVRKLLQKFKSYMNGKPPPFRLTKHCNICPFTESCRKKAVEKDDLSLLYGISEKKSGNKIIRVFLLSNNYLILSDHANTKQQLNYYRLQAVVV